MDAHPSVTVRCAVEYDGTAFYGFQFQPTVRTVAGTLERVFSQMFGHAVKLTGAGRTDTGVHATGQVVSFTTTKTAFPFDRLGIAANSALPGDLSIRDVALVDDAFSARFTATQRAYVYAIHRRADRSALLAHRAYHVYRPLDVESMRTAAAALVGEHDFRSFCATLPENGVTVRTVHHLELIERGDLLLLHVAADGFLHRMVRTIVGTLVECGIGRRDPHGLADVVRARSRAAAGLTAPPHGLYLAGVRYRDGYDSFLHPMPA